VTAKGLYFLVSPPYGSIQYLVKTDGDGVCAGTIVLPERVSPLWFSVDSDTSFSVLSNPNLRKIERLELDNTGWVISRVLLEKPADQMISTGDQWIGVSNGGSVAIYDRQGAIAKTFVPAPQEPVAQRLVLTPLSDTLFMLIRSQTAQADLIDLADGTARQMLVAPDDFAVAFSHLTEPKQASVVLSATGDKNGYAFLSLWDYRPAEGGLVVKVDQTGNVVQRYRCVLPTRERYAFAGNPGFIFPGLIKTFGNRLYVTDRRGTVGKYILP
jgi:hypothetical protein